MFTYKCKGVWENMYLINYSRGKKKARNGLKHVEQEKVCLP